MLRYLYADLIRVLKKISFWVIALFPAILYALFIFVERGHYRFEYGSEQAIYHISMLPMVFTIFLGSAVLITVFHHDFRAKVMQNVIGSGVARWKALLAKMIEATILSALAAAITALIIIITMAVLNIPISSEQIGVIFSIFIVEAFYAIAIIGLVSPILFFFQSAIGGIIVYLIIATQALFFALILMLTSSQVVESVGDLTPYLPTQALTEILKSLLHDEAIETSKYIVISAYLLAPTIASMILFQYKDLEI